LKEELLYANGTLIGYLQTQEDENRIFIFGIYLLNSYQSIGYGNELFRQLFFLGKNIELEVFKINHKAIRFYERLGFKRITETEHHYQYRIVPQTSQTYADLPRQI
jgi:ribosomal protein S18 acetylase RimI-like enzyme